MERRAYTGPAEQVLANADAIAERRGHQIVGTEHLLLALATTDGGSFARRLLDELEVTDVIRHRVHDLIGSDEADR